MEKRNSLFRLLRNNKGFAGGSDADVDYDAIADAAYNELEAEKNGTPLPEKKEKQPDDPKPEDQEGEEDGEDIESDEDQPGEEEDTPEKESESDPETEKSEEEKEQELKASVEEHAQKHGMTYDEAKEDIEKTNKIIEQFKNDPKEMARAIRNKDREYDKLKNQLEEKDKAEPVFEALTEDQFRTVAREKIEADSEKFIEAYRKKYPGKSEAMSNAAIIDEVLDRQWSRYQSYAKDKESELRKEANDKREQYLSSVAAEDRKFIPEVKAMLHALKDKDVLIKDWKPEYLLHIVKGKRYDADIKAAREEGKKTGKEAPKILGVKSGSQPASSPKKTSGTSLNKAQKEAALDMYGADYGDDETCYKLYKETFAEELKKDPNFV